MERFRQAAAKRGVHVEIRGLPDGTKTAAATSDAIGGMRPFVFVDALNLPYVA